MNPRIIKAAEYFKSLKPSEFIVGSSGVVSPTKWRELMSFCDLILDTTTQEQEKLIEEAEEVFE